MDNQLLHALNPIIVYPTIIPKDQKSVDEHPILHAAIVKVKDQAHGVDYYKYFTILLQELSIDLEEDFLFSMVDFFALPTDIVPMPTLSYYFLFYFSLLDEFNRLAQQIVKKNCGKNWAPCLCLDRQRQVT